MEAKSPHFTVVTDAGDKQAQQVALRFEQIRAAFHLVFPNLKLDPSGPIIIIAVTNRESFDALTPPAWHAKGQLRRAGLFQRSPEKNYVLLKLNTESEYPYHLLFHEYTHLVLSLSDVPVPLWLNEGLAEFYGYSRIDKKDVLLGAPIRDDVELLRDSKLIPLPTLFTVDYKSPYYNEENKGTIFYAESWALTHYLMVKGFRDKESSLAKYFEFMGEKADSVTAATRAFGDLGKLQKRLEQYIRQMAFQAIRVPGSTEIDERSFSVQELPVASSEAIRGDFLVSIGVFPAAETLLKDALKKAPKDAAAYESMGVLELREMHLGEAQRWFTEAVQLNSRSYLALYYYGVTTMRQQLDAATEGQVENSLREAIQVRPDFAPAYDALAAFYGMRREKLDEAHRLALIAVSLDPGNLGYRLTTAQIVLRLNEPDYAIQVAQAAQGLAKSLQEAEAVQRVIQQAQEIQHYTDAQRQAAAQFARELAGTQPSENTSAGETQPPGPISALPPPSPSGPPPRLVTRTLKVMLGKIKDVRCSAPAVIDIEFEAAGHTFDLHSDNYYRIPFEAIDFSPSGELHPCQNLKGRRARISFHEVVGHTDEGEIISVDLYQ